MDWYGDLVDRTIRRSNAAGSPEDTQPMMQNGVRIHLVPTVEPISDPLAELQTTEDLLNEAALGKTATSWMQRLRKRKHRGARANPRSGTIRFEGRVCCYEHLVRYEGRANMQYPFETTCPSCGAAFRVRLTAIHG